MHAGEEAAKSDTISCPRSPNVARRGEMAEEGKKELTEGARTQDAEEADEEDTEDTDTEATLSIRNGML